MSKSPRTDALVQRIKELPRLAVEQVKNEGGTTLEQWEVASKVLWEVLTQVALHAKDLEDELTDLKENKQ